MDITAQPDFRRDWAPRAGPMAAVGDMSLDSVPDSPGADAGAACRAVLIDFHAAVDHGRATDALDLFTDDASVDVAGQRMEGREQIASFLARRQAQTDRHTVHVIANDVVREQTADRLVLTAKLQLYERAADGSFALQRIVDTTQTFRLQPDGWRIAERVISSATADGD